MTGGEPHDLIGDPDLGLTKRELFAALMAHALANAIQQDPDQLLDWNSDAIASVGIKLADALLNQLSKTQSNQ